MFPQFPHSFVLILLLPKKVVQKKFKTSAKIKKFLLKKINHLKVFQIKDFSLILNFFCRIKKLYVISPPN
ncbi:hypothetical protein EZS27_003713 [termite gut metagenome]|uniref:Uncharacterized protein n=1 Tax=termite gut metagenome TaxID=433724 RepID=A0A5J4SRS9_9ZZZZ